MILVRFVYNEKILHWQWRYYPVLFEMKKRYEKIEFEQQFLLQTIAYGHMKLPLETPRVIGLTIFHKFKLSENF